MTANSWSNISLVKHRVLQGFLSSTIKGPDRRLLPLKCSAGMHSYVSSSHSLLCRPFTFVIKGVFPIYASIWTKVPFTLFVSVFNKFWLTCRYTTPPGVTHQAKSTWSFALITCKSKYINTSMVLTSLTFRFSLFCLKLFFQPFFIFKT